MKSSPSLQKHSVKNFFEEITSFDLFFQLTYMSATSAAGISRARVFHLARQLPITPAKYFKSIHEVAENLRYNYPDAVRLIGEQAKSEDTKTFLLRLSDALRSGEPLPSFLAREAHVQGENYANDYLRSLESMKKWTDAFAAVVVSASLIVIINMVMTMIYNIGTVMMATMVMVALASGFAVAWLIFRASPQEVTSVPLALGSKEQRLSRKLLYILLPLTTSVCTILALLGLDKGWILIVAGLLILPLGIVSSAADKKTRHKDAEISSFLRSLGGNATSRGTTLKDALASMKIDSFPSLQADIRMLDLRLKAYVKPEICWKTFGLETGSKLAEQATSIFTQAVGLGGDPETAGNVTSAFALKTANLRAQRRGITAAFSWLSIAMHTILAGLMVFLLGILEQFAIRMNEAMTGLGQGADSVGAMGLKGMFSFDAAQLHYLTTITVGMVIMLTLVTAFAVVASEGAHLIKMSFYFALLLIDSGICFLTVPSLVRMVM